LNQGYQPSRELALDLFRHTMTILAKFKMPRIIEFVEALPKTISGKIRRIELREDEIIRKNKGATPKQTEFFYKDFPELSTKRE
jgi:acetyl-CoA synthetase/4-hydroxybutyrate---CoA ligase (AMP-forming)